jgi:hypothetical protein
MEKIFNQKNFKYFWTPLGSKVVNFCLQVQVCSLIFFPYFATSINNTSETGAKFAPGAVDTDGNFAAGVVDTSGAP